ncbi:MAG: YHS domain-containing protein, partial [Pseudomonadota bacterium]
MTEQDVHAGHHSHDHAGHRHMEAGPASAQVIEDPVCGMQVNPATAPHRADHRGKTYFFCSAECHGKFEANPSAYVATEARSRPAREQPKGVIYTCPMHPQIRQVGPGNCPICGMTLEPE